LSAAASVRVRTVAETAAAGQDYGAVDRLLTFAPGVGRADVDLAVHPDAEVEGTETFRLRLLSPRGALLGTQRTMTVTILDR
jgi:hypothetical protein